MLTFIDAQCGRRGYWLLIQRVSLVVKRVVTHNGTKRLDCYTLLGQSKGVVSKMGRNYLAVHAPYQNRVKPCAVAGLT